MGSAEGLGVVFISMYLASRCELWQQMSFFLLKGLFIALITGTCLIKPGHPDPITCFNQVRKLLVILCCQHE